MSELFPIIVWCLVVAPLGAVYVIMSALSRR